MYKFINLYVLEETKKCLPFKISLMNNDDPIIIHRTDESSNELFCYEY
jgi:hypothetical protein